MQGGKKRSRGREVEFLIKGLYSRLHAVKVPSNTTFAMILHLSQHCSTGKAVGAIDRRELTHLLMLSANNEEKTE